MRYEFKKLLPAEKALPAPSNEYWELETAKTFHYRWSDWVQEPMMYRAKLMAHELHRGMRESYTFEQRMESAEQEKPKGPAPWDSVRQHFMSK